MIPKIFIVFLWLLPTYVGAQVEKISPTQFRVNAAAIPLDSPALSFAKGDTLYLASDILVFNIKQYEDAQLYRSCCHQLNGIGEALIKDYYKTLARSDTQYQQQVELNRKTTDLFVRFMDSTRTTTKAANELLTSTREDLSGAKKDLNNALKEIKTAKWLLPVVGTVATILGLVIGLTLSKK